jgi:pimeloyl-ACP methyl ester carboxylesterase
MYIWIDSSRIGQPGADSGTARRIAARVWYPTRTGGTLAVYAPFDTTLSAVRTNARESAPITRARRRMPLVVICPGRGLASWAYTGLAESLASDGFAVMAVDMPLIGDVRFSNTERIAPSPRFRPPPGLMAGPYIEVDRFYEEARTLGEADVSLALRALASERSLASAINFDRLGAFGHSLGGRICGAFAARDPRVRVLATMEGVPPRDVREGGLSVPVVQFISATTPDVALPNYRAVGGAGRAPVWLVTIRGFQHNSFTDLPVIDPERYPSPMPAAQALALARLLLHDAMSGPLWTNALPTVRSRDSTVAVERVTLSPD